MRQSLKADKGIGPYRVAASVGQDNSGPDGKDDRKPAKQAAFPGNPQNAAKLSNGVAKVSSHAPCAGPKFGGDDSLCHRRSTALLVGAEFEPIGIHRTVVNDVFC